MSIPMSRLVIPILALLGACMPAAVKQSGPAPANALTCAQESLQRLGFSSMDMSKGGDSFYARRTVDSAWVHRIEHVVNVSTRTDGRPTLHVRGERVHNKEGWPGLPGLILREPESYRMRIEADDLLKSEIAQVIRECSGPAQYGAAAAR